MDEDVKMCTGELEVRWSRQQSTSPPLVGFEGTADYIHESMLNVYRIIFTT
jgi:hypothetical protein